MTTISGSNGVGYLTLTGAETNCSLMVVVAKVASGPKATILIDKPRVLPILLSGTATAGGNTSITLAAGAYDLTGCIVRTTGGTGGGGTGGANNQARVITAYSTSTLVATVEPAWETNPDSTTTYDILLTELACNTPVTRGLRPTTDGRTLVVDSAGLADANTVKLGPTGSGTAQTARDIGASVLLSNGTGTGQVKLASGYVAMTWADIAAPTTTVNLSGTTIATVTNQLTAAQIATGVWQDTTAGDFTTAGSIGKSLFTSGNVPGAAGGLMIAGSNAATTVNITGNITGNLSGSVGSVTGLTTATIATAVWTDTTASDFTTTSSPGKIIVSQLGGAFTTTSSSVFATAALANAPGGSLTVSAIWSEALPGAYATGTAGKLLSTAATAADPLLNSVPGSYASGTAGAALGKIGTGNVTTVSPISVAGAIEIVRGCDYNNTDGYAIEWTDTNADTAWPTLTSATITVGIEYGGTAYTFSGSVVTATGTPKKVRWEPTAANTNSLPATTGEGATYKVIATLTSGRIVPLAGDLITVLDNPVR